MAIIESEMISHPQHVLSSIATSHKDSRTRKKSKGEDDTSQAILSDYSFKHPRFRMVHLSTSLHYLSISHHYLCRQNHSSWLDVIVDLEIGQSCC